MLEKIKTYLQKAKEARQPHETEIRSAFLFTKPSRRFMQESDQPITRVNVDATIGKSAQNLVTNVTKYLIPQNRRWHDITIKNPLRKTFLNKLDRALVEANEFMFQFYQESNFYSAISEVLGDAVISGTGCILILDRDGKDIDFKAISVSELYFLEDADGTIDSVFREFTLDTRQLKKRYPDVELPDEKIERHQILECCYPCEQGFEYKVILKDKEWLELESKETPWNPFIVFRWQRDTGSVWGTSPVRMALPHASVINKMVQDTVTYGEWVSKSGWQSESDSFQIDQLKGQLKPGCVISVEQELKPLPFPGNFPITFDLIRMQAEAIKQTMLDNTLPSEDALKYMRAEAIIQQQAQFLQYIGEPAQRLSVELLRPLGAQVVSRMMFRGDLLIVPQDDVKHMNIPGVHSQEDIFRIDVNAAIHRANKMQEAGNAMNALGTVSKVVAGIPQQVGIHLDMDKFIRQTLLALDVDIDQLRDPKESTKLTEELGGQSKILQMMQMASQGAGIAKDLNSAGILPGQ